MQFKATIKIKIITKYDTFQLFDNWFSSNFIRLLRRVKTSLFSFNLFFIYYTYVFNLKCYMHIYMI